MNRAKLDQKSKSLSTNYSKFKKINGDHPLKELVPAIYVGYDAYYRTGGSVLYFNFELAKDMGLIPEDHPHQLNKMLENEILDTFSLQILNEFDVLNKVKVDESLLKKNQYMATRYLQLQHPNKQGKTSGDGRSIWNGSLKTRKGAWDITSCGTGATRLSPATAIEQQFFRTGSRTASYGCGRAAISEGVIAGLFSEMLYRQGLRTERTLAVIQFKNGNAVNVRAGKNLLRPAHFFGFLKRGNYESLKQLADYYIEREQTNKNFPDIHNDEDKYETLLAVFAKRFARAAAMFESEYLFCWMDWDGDNILMDGGIIDYGSVRQFGLFHHHYRYEDVDKMSTTITEQKNKAKFTVQTFAQAMDYLQTGKKKNKDKFKSHWSIDLFDQVFQVVLLQQTLKKMGIPEIYINTMLEDKSCWEEIQKFQKQLRYFERAVAGRKEYAVADGIMRDAIFCVRDFLREFPRYYLDKQQFIPADEFIEMVSSDYASRLDKAKYRKKGRRIKNLQKSYIQIIHMASEGFQKPINEILEIIKTRVEIIDPEDKLTGNGIITLTDRIVREKSQLSNYEVHSLMAAIIDDNTLNPEYEPSFVEFKLKRSATVNKLLKWGRKKRDMYKQTI